MFSVRVAMANQYACESIIEADEQFKKSCEMCCSSPQCLWHDCERCKVAEIHKDIIKQLKKNIVTRG